MRLAKAVLYLLAVLLTAGTLACSLESSLRDRSRGDVRRDVTATKKVAAIGDIQAVGKVPVDEFNDLATGKETPSDGGQVVIQFSAEPNSLNVWTDTSAYSSYITGYLYNALLRRDPETYEWEGSLAERWIEEDIVVKKDGTKLRGKVSPGAEAGKGDVALVTSSGESVRLSGSEVQEIRRGVVLTFFLRRDVKFHDGQPLTAADVKFSFETIKNEHVDAPSLRNYYKDLESCEVLDKYTVRMTYAKQYWMARDFAGGFEVLPKHLYDSDSLQAKDPEAFGKRFNDSPYNRKPIGTGP